MMKKINRIPIDYSIWFQQPATSDNHAVSGFVCSSSVLDCAFVMIVLIANLAWVYEQNIYFHHLFVVCPWKCIYLVMLWWAGDVIKIFATLDGARAPPDDHEPPRSLRSSNHSSCIRSALLLWFFLLSFLSVCSSGCGHSKTRRPQAAELIDITLNTGITAEWHMPVTVWECDHHFNLLQIPHRTFLAGLYKILLQKPFLLKNL